MHLVDRGVLGGRGIERARHRSVGALQLRQQVRADRQQVAARQRVDLADVAEARAHHLGGDAELLVVGVDLADRLHAGVVGAGHRGLVPLGAGGLLVPVVDAADEGADQLDAGVAAGHRLAEGEQQRQVAADAFLLELARRLDAFPGGGDLDQHPLARDARGLVQRDQAVRTRDRGGSVEAQARVDLGRDAARHHLQDLQAEAHQHLVDDLVERAAAVRRHRLGQQRRVLGLLHRLQDQRRIGRRILRRELGELLEVAGVGDDGGELLELIELIHGVGVLKDTRWCEKRRTRRTATGRH